MKGKFKVSSDFIKGYSRIFDLFGVTREYTPPRTPEDDYRAMQSDWNNVGMDLRKALNRYGRTGKEATE